MEVWHVSDIRSHVYQYLEPLDRLCLTICLVPGAYPRLPQAVEERVAVSTVLTSYSVTRSKYIEARLKMLSDNRATRYRTHTQRNLWRGEITIVREQLQQCQWHQSQIVGKTPDPVRDVESFVQTYHSRSARGNGNVDAMHTLYQLRLLFFLLYVYEFHFGTNGARCTKHSGECIQTMRDALKFGVIKEPYMKKFITAVAESGACC